MFKNKVCPNCKELSLQQITEKEMKKLQDQEGKEVLPYKIFGCRKCKFWCDSSVLEK